MKHNSLELCLKVSAKGNAVDPRFRGAQTCDGTLSLIVVEGTVSSDLKPSQDPGSPCFQLHAGEMSIPVSCDGRFEAILPVGTSGFTLYDPLSKSERILKDVTIPGDGRLSLNFTAAYEALQAYEGHINLGAAPSPCDGDGVGPVSLYADGYRLQICDGVFKGRAPASPSGVRLSLLDPDGVGSDFSAQLPGPADVLRGDIHFPLTWTETRTQTLLHWVQIHFVQPHASGELLNGALIQVPFGQAPPPDVFGGWLPSNVLLNLSLFADSRVIGTRAQYLDGLMARDVVPMFPLDVIVFVDGAPPSAAVCKRFILQDRASVPVQEADGNCHLRTLAAYGGAETSYQAVVMDTLTGATFAAGSAFQSVTLHANLPPLPATKRYRIRPTMMGLPWQGPFALTLFPAPGPIGSITARSYRTPLTFRSEGKGFVEADLPAWAYDVILLGESAQFFADKVSLRDL